MKLFDKWWMLKLPIKSMYTTQKLWLLSWYFMFCSRILFSSHFVSNWYLEMGTLILKTEETDINSINAMITKLFHGKSQAYKIYKSLEQFRSKSSFRNEWKWSMKISLSPQCTLRSSISVLIFWSCPILHVTYVNLRRK